MSLRKTRLSVVVAAALLLATQGCSESGKESAEVGNPLSKPPSEAAKARRAEQVPQKPTEKDAGKLVAESVPQEPSPTAPAAPAEVAPSEPVDLALAKRYLGDHSLGVNRVTDGRRKGLVNIRDEAGRLLLEGSVAKGKYDLAIKGEVKPKSKTEFLLEGTIAGKPNLEWRGEEPRHRTTQGSFLFRAKGKRKYWRLYEIDGKDCVCWDDCGNDFCYIDIGFGPPKR